VVSPVCLPFHGVPMSKKYLNLEEAAALLRMATSELNKLREKGEIRAFADRGNWKFREEDVDTLLRSRQADSNPDLPLLPSDSSNEFVLGDDEDVLSDEPTIIRKNKNASSSDSDIRLMLDDSDSSVSDVVLPLSDSDSDVKLVGETRSKGKSASDSDVKLVGESGVLADNVLGGGPGSDSDVKLIGATSDSDVRLIGDSVIGLKPDSDSDVKLAPSTPKREIPKLPAVILPMDDDEGISLAPLDDGPASKAKKAPIPSPAKPAMGGSVLDDDALPSLAGDSGISLDRVADSGISLDGGSALNLDGDSGLSLDLASDSGISLVGDSAAPLSGGSGKGKGKGKGPAVSSDDDLHATAPMMNIPLDDDDDITDTNLEIPLSSGDSSNEYDSTGVISLDDDEEDLDEVAATTVTKRGGRGSAVTQEIENDSSDEMFAAVDEGSDEFDDSVEVSDDVIGEDDEVSADVFGADDEDFGDVEEGESISDMAVPAGRMMAPVEQDWGALAFTGVLLSSLVLLGTATVMYELVRNMWHTDLSGVNPVAGGLIDTIGGMF
jgi:hypothetical protein